MEDYTQWNYKEQNKSDYYRGVSMSISKLFRNTDEKIVKNYLNYLKNNHHDFLKTFKNSILIKLIIEKHFSTADSFLYLPDTISEDVLKSCLLGVTISFDEEVFDYVIFNINKLDKQIKYPLIISFLNIFLSGLRQKI